MAKTEQQRKDTITVVFLADQVVYNGEGDPIAAFEKGEEVELKEDAAWHWLRRGKARRADEPVQAAKEDPKAASLEAVMNAIGKLDPTDATLWQENGAPKIDAIERYTDGAKVTVATRDLAWVKVRNPK